jgi:hypothetical protein
MIFKWLGMAAAAAAALALGSCTHMHVESITYQTGACFGTCPVYTVTVHANGQGLFTGTAHTTVTGPHPFTVTPAQYQAFVNQLAPIRPASGIVRYDHTPTPCTHMATDMPSVDVKWHTFGNQQQELYYYYGCFFTGSPALGQRLSAAPNLLPIGSFIH